MISLSKRADTKPTIKFSSRSGKDAPDLKKQLQYGYKCTWCGNVILAFFYTDEPVDLSLYEETNVMGEGEKNESEVVKIISNDKDDGGYKIDFYRTPSGNAQLIRLKNHIANQSGFINRDAFFELGERCCPYTGLFVMKEQRVVSSFCALLGTPTSYWRSLPFMPVELFDTYQSLATYYNNISYKLATKFGDCANLMLGLRSDVRYISKANKCYYMYEAWKQEKDKYNVVAGKGLKPEDYGIDAPTSISSAPNWKEEYAATF